jgi:hypothetical protein
VRATVAIDKTTRTDRGIKRTIMAGALAMFGVLTGRRAGAADCPPVAVVEGAVGIVQAVRTLLRAHGIASDPDSCPQRVVRASLSAAPGSNGYALHVVDAFGRTNDRHVSDAVTAASLIESWAVPDAEGFVRLRSISTTSARPAKSAPLPGATPALPWRLAAAIELAAGTDSSLWYGGTVTGCGRIASLCIGGRARVGRDEGIAGPRPDGGDLSRTMGEALVLVSLPLTNGSLAFNPMIGIGSDWTHSEVLPPGSDSDPVVTDAIGLRLEAAAGVGLTVSQHISLVVEVSASLGRSIGSSAPSGAGTFVVTPPAGYLRVGIGCQYSP